MHAEPCWATSSGARKVTGGQGVAGSNPAVPTHVGRLIRNLGLAFCGPGTKIEGRGSVLTRLDRWSSDPCLQNKRGLSDTVAHLGLRLQGISQDRLASDLLWSGLVVSRRNAAERRTFGSWRQRDTKPGPKSG